MTEAQAEALDKLLKLKQTQIGIVLALIVSEEELIQRLLNRGLSSGRPDDNNVEVIRARITEYQIKTALVADYYRKFNKVVDIPGEGSVDEIFDSLCKKMDERMV